jgi:hypothetical protein
MRKAKSVTSSELRHHIREMMVATIGCNPRKIPMRIKPVSAKQILEPREKNSEAKRMGMIKHHYEGCSKRMKQPPDGKFGWTNDCDAEDRSDSGSLINSYLNGIL